MLFYGMAQGTNKTLNFYVNDTDGNQSYRLPTDLLTEDVWYDVVATWRSDTGVCSLYVDGVMLTFWNQSKQRQW